jgi:hypothetical protein
MDRGYPTHDRKRWTFFAMLADNTKPDRHARVWMHV